MKTLALAGLMTISAIAGSAITLSLSQTSFAQDSQKDDGHWTQQHPAGATHAQQQAATRAQFAKNQQYTEYKYVGAEVSADDFIRMVNAEMSEGWQPLGDLTFHCRTYTNHCGKFQTLVR